MSKKQMMESTNMEQKEQLLRYKKKLHSEIDEMFEKMLAILSGDSISVQPEPYELSLTLSPAQFKGLKPSAILYPNGKTVIVRTWREVVEKLLKDCDSTMHEKLWSIVDNMQGRTRSIMAHSAEELENPMRIGDGIYMECRYDTETLLRLMMKRIFDVIGYEYADIKIKVR